MNKQDKTRINEARLELIYWVRENKGQSLKYANKTQLCDRINRAFMPLIGDELPINSGLRKPTRK